MANFTYTDYENKKGGSTTANKEYKVGFFGLKDDGDEAIVRFAYSSLEEFNIVTVHSVKTTTRDGKETYKRVSCLREGQDSVSKCPLCASGNKLASKFYVKLIEYVKDENGKITPKARVWERPAKFAKELKSFMDEYGDLTNFIFKVKRRGNRGSMDTTYDIIPTRQDVYKQEVYVKNFSDFDGYKMAGSSYLVKTADEMNAYLTAGDFPRTESVVAKTPAPAMATTRPVAPTTPTTQATPAPKPVDAQPARVEQEKPKPANPTEGRPQRYTF